MARESHGTEIGCAPERAIPSVPRSARGRTLKVYVDRSEADGKGDA